MVGMYSFPEISRKGIEAGSPWECRLNFKNVFLVVVLLVAGSSKQCLAQSLNDAVAYLDNVEREVMRVAAKATENFNNSCDLVASCGGSCSRQSCQPLEGDLNLMACKNVLRNPTCSDAQGNLGCSQTRVNFARSYVRLPTPPNVTLTTAANYTICSQRMLEPLFLEISGGHNSAMNLTSWFYFGSVEGVQRSFPGRDQRLRSCTFEPRKRPWYMGATAVQKDLVILLDGGNSMGDYLPGDIFQSRDFTKFNASVSIIKELLDTLTYGDRVSVISFSSSTTKANLVYKTMTSTGNSSDMQPLKDVLGALAVDNKAGTSSLLTGMLKANQTFTRGATTNALKIMVVITDGQFAADPTVLPTLAPVLNSFSSQQVLTLLYSFDRTDPARATLSSIACSVNGTYERVNQTVLNPLWTLRSYFGTIAYWRLKAQSFKPYWSKPYQDSGSLGEVITVAYPAFAPDNYTLIGVVGSDILMTELGSTSTGFSQALVGRPNDDSISVTPEPLHCNLQLSTSNVCPSVVPPANPLCFSNDTSNVSFEERVCTCPPQCKAPQGNATSTTTISPAVYGAAGGGGVLALLALAFLVIYCCKRRSKARKLENQPVSVAVSKSPSSGISLTSGAPKSSNSARRENSVVSESVSYSVSSAPSSARSRPTGSKSVKAAAWPVNQTLKRDLVCFSMEDLEYATENWSDNYLVGRGACGSVYSGELHGVTRAIKRPHPEVDVAKPTFDKELDLLSKLNHRCLVRVIGYCEEEHVLVFEYMEFGTLEDCLHGNRLGRCLSWQERLNIAAGASRGLEYLHEYATTLIIHGDVKPANILLDEKLDAHIADFGLSLSSHDQDATMLYATRMGGTPGYFDPEYASLGSFTPKSDVYSFGVVLLELFSGRKVVQERRNITTWASEMYEEDVAAILDPHLERPQGVEFFHSIIALALQCVQTEHRYRPKMKDVASKLSSAAADWYKFEHETSPNVRKHPSRRQRPQYRPVSLDADEFQDDHGQLNSRRIMFNPRR